jgi:glycosyltransferase domain-containing protein
MISLLIPTTNRSYFVMRLLAYYRDVGFPGQILIGDSSDGEHLERTRKVAGDLRGSLNIVYREFSGISEHERLVNMLESVSTGYMAILPDTGFLVPTGITRCISFLEAQPEYAAAHGLAATFNLYGFGAYGEFRAVASCRQAPLEHENAAQRLLSLLRSYTVPFSSVYRTSQMRAAFKSIAPSPNQTLDETFAIGLLPSCLTAVQGKIKEIDCFYLARQAKDGQNLSQETFDWITGPSWLASYRLFRDAVAQRLARQDGISTDAAKEVIKEGLWQFLSRAMTANPEIHIRRRENKVKALAKDFAVRMPGVQRAYHNWRSLRPSEEYKFKVNALLRGTSPYYKDFMPIYRSINNPVDLLDGSRIG